VVKLTELLFAPLSPLLSTTRSLSYAVVDSAIILRTRIPLVASSGTPFVVAVVFVTGLRTCVLFSNEVPPVAVVFNGFSDLNVMSDVISTCFLFFWGGGGVFF